MPNYDTMRVKLSLGSGLLLLRQRSPRRWSGTPTVSYCSHGGAFDLSSRGAGAEEAHWHLYLCDHSDRGSQLGRKYRESYSTPEAASEAGWLALDRIRATKKADQS